MKRFEIWWSPMGGKQNGRKVIEAETKEDAKQAAFAEMRRHGSCGAWGADLVQEGEE